MRITKLVLASQNQGKVKELTHLLADLNIHVVSATDAGVTDDIAEDADTLEGNAIKKATHIAQKAGQWAAADDSGLFIQALNGAPGIFSTRWAGPGFDKEKLGDFALEKLRGVPADKRAAYWQCAIALVAPTGEHWTFTGKVEGKITMEKRGQPRPHMPYDTVFQPDGDARTMAEMAVEEKNAISHRSRAIAKLKKFIINKVNSES